jgi:hypothetical protein
MISPETRAEIRRHFYAEHWKIGTIARELNVHPDAVRNAIESERFKSMQPLRASVVDPYLEFIRDTLERHPRLRATRLYVMALDLGYTRQCRATALRCRPAAAVDSRVVPQTSRFPGEQGQVDWAHFGDVMVGRTKRALSCFVLTLSRFRRGSSIERR